VGKTLYLQRAPFSGENIAKYSVYIDSVLSDVKRTWFSGGMDDEFVFTGNNGKGLEVAENTDVEIEVENFRNSNADFNAKIIGILE
jgi:hypothetical protein